MIWLGPGQASAGHREREREEVVGLEAEIHVGELDDTVDCESAPGKERQGQGELDDDERAPHAMAAAGDRRCGRPP